MRSVKNPAISYLLTIKSRFSNDFNTYHSFLETFHMFQKEQRCIKDVLEQVRGMICFEYLDKSIFNIFLSVTSNSTICICEQVSVLFADHPDLMMEFTYFLPEAFQEQVMCYINQDIVFMPGF
jgi:paired amphipathic helix protein Sin3a